MSDERLEKLLEEDNINVPKTNFNSKEIISYCECKTRKITKKRLIFSLSSFVLIGIIVLSFVLINNVMFSNVSKINNSIANLDSIDNDEEKMLEIMKIEKDIENISVKQQTKIDMSKLSYESAKTIKNLKSSVEWSVLFEIDEQYCDIGSIGDLSNVLVAKINENSLRPSDAYEERINDAHFNKSFLSLVDVPYSEINSLEDDNLLINMFRKELNEDDYRSPFYVMYNVNDYNFFEFMIHPSGYIVITNKKLLEDEITVYKKYVSIVRVNYEDFAILLNKDNLKKYNLYKNYNIAIDELNINKIDISSIEFLSVSENGSSSIVKIINDKNDIDSIISFINNENVLFDKEIYYVNSYDLSCITIGIALKLSDGSTDNISCKISNEGVLKLKTNILI